MDKRLLQLVAEERLNRKRQLRTLMILALAIAVGLGGILFALKELGRSQQPAKVVIDPSRLPPIQPGPR